MKKTVICSIPIRDKFYPQVYSSEDVSLPASEKAYYFPVDSFLEKQISGADEFNVIMLVKEDPDGNYKANIEKFQKEFGGLCDEAGAKYSFKEVKTPFAEDVATHKQFLTGMVDALGEKETIICDITYGSKDVPILVFNALTFAEKFLGCEIENILYGQAVFENNKVKASHLRDVTSLYYLNGITEKLPEVEAEKARELFKVMISL